MAILRREQQGRFGTSNCFDALVETTADFELPEAESWTVGSMAYCIADGKVYAKTETGWEAVTE